MKWKCRNGREILIREMETSHIENTIRFLRRKGAVTESEYDAKRSNYSMCLAYAYRNDTPDGASLAAYMEAENMEIDLDKMLVSVELQHLIDELAARESIKTC